jgi:hypothetical protein
MDQLVLARPEGKDNVGGQADGEDHIAGDAGDPQERSRVPSVLEILAEDRARLGVAADPQFA